MNKLLLQIQKQPVAILLSIACIIRLFSLFIYEGYSIFPDSEGYIELADYISNFSFDNYNGKRTPGYPLVIALLGKNLKLVSIFQQLLGILSTYLLYDLIQRDTQNKIVAFSSSLLFTIFIHVLFFEFTVLTETLSLSLIIVIFWFIKTKNILSLQASFSSYIILSILMAFTYIVRPMFIYLPIFLVLVLLFNFIKTDFRKVATKSIILITIPFLIFYFWASTNEKNIGVFGSTYLMGINITQTATSFFEKVPDEHKTVREIFVRKRDSIAKFGKPHEYAMAVWFAQDEMQNVLQLNEQGLSAYLGKISLDLFKKHPELYLKQVAISWIDFWKVKLLWRPLQFKSTVVKNIFMGSWLYIQKWICIILKIAFLLFSIKKIVWFFKNRFPKIDFELLLILFVLAGSFAQAIITYGSNARFSFPYLPLIIYIVAFNLSPYFKTYVTNPSA